MMQTSAQQELGKASIVFSSGEKYKTWYDFKKDLESLCGRPILNNLWLQIKPRTALPWNSSNLRASLVFKESLK